MYKKSNKILLVICIVIAIGGLTFYITKLSMQRWFLQQYSVPSPDTTIIGNTKILLIWDRGIGENDTIQRLKIAAQTKPIDLRVVSQRPRWYIRLFIKDPINIARNEFQPDFILTIQDYIPYQPGIPNYMTLTHGTARYIQIDKRGHAQIATPDILQYDALLPSFQDIELLKSIYERSGKKFIGFAWYPSVYASAYEPATAHKLFYSGGFRWDNTRNSSKYQDLFKQLDATGYLLVSGPKRKWKITPHSAVGFIPDDGKSLIKEIHQAGIALVLHHTEHLEGGAPTSRIFEAAAANAVIISDRHPFIMQHFGNNVLYIDIDQDAVGMFKQIDDHMQWIFANPAQAQQMAQNCHKINNEFYTLEQQLDKLLEMHSQHMQTSDKA